MIFALALSLIATTGGALATYLYDEDAPLASRLCSGACIGFATLGLVGFIAASFLGLGPATLIVSALVLGSPFVLLSNARRRVLVRNDITESYRGFRYNVLHLDLWTLFYIGFYLVVTLVMWLSFANAMFERPDGIYTGVLNNYGDLPFHLSVITRFAFGQNFPAEDPTYAGVRFTYPFLTDLVSAMFVRAGASLRDSMFIENIILAVAFVGVIHYWALRLLRDRLAAVITPVLIVLSGGLGWLVFLKNAKDSEVGVWGLLKKLPHSYTIVPETTWRWGNAMTSLLLTQRGILLGIPLAVIVFTQWWVAAEPRRNGERGKGGNGEDRKGGRSKFKKNVAGKKGKDTTKPTRSDFPFPLSPFPPQIARMLAAGIVAGLLPLVHAHTFVVVMGVGAALALGTYWRAWAVALAALLLLALGYSANLFPASSLKIVLPIVAAGVSLMVWYLLPPAHRLQWLVFFLASLIVALPQLWWSTHGSAVQAGSFLGWQFGWDSADEIFFKTSLLDQSQQTIPGVRAMVIRFLDIAWFWLKNTGAFIPLIVTALIWRKGGRLVSRRLLWFYLPFTFCFVIPNMVKMAPWIWDNVKVLFYWWVASAPLVALVIAKLWQGSVPRRILAASLLLVLTFAGALDVFALATSQGEYREFDRDGMAFAESVKQQTPEHAVVLHAPIHNHPVFLTGRRSVMGYPGHIWTHGLQFAQRQSDIKRIYAGGPDAPGLLATYGVNYVVVSPWETHEFPVNEAFFARYPQLGETGGYRLYKITP
jgi:hypothetical protein